MDSLTVVKELSIEQKAELFQAIIDYQNGDEIILTGLMKVVFIPFKNQFIRDDEKYYNEVKASSDKGKLGNLKRWHNDLYLKVIENQLDIDEAINIAKHRPPIVSDEPNRQASPKSLDSDSKNDSDSDKVKKEKAHTLLPSADHSIPQSEIDRFNHYSSWAAENAPKLLKIKKPLTAKQFVDIRSRYSLEQFKEVCLAMEAKKDFLSKYDNLNLTMQSWLKRQFGAGGNSQPPPKIPLQKGIEMPELVTPVVDFLANGQ